jgi:hypothetical protein
MGKTTVVIVGFAILAGLLVLGVNVAVLGARDTYMYVTEHWFSHTWGR